MSAQETLQAGRKALNVVIVGGSIAGLMAGILLKRQGHNVRILEQADSSQRQGLAAGVGLQGHVRKFFDNEDRLEQKDIGIPNDELLIVNSNLEVKYKIFLGMRMTTWDTAYYRLRANFDALKSSYCPTPPPEIADSSEGEAIFETGKKVLNVEELNGHMTVTAQDVRTNSTEQYTGDIIIAADGGNSTIRRLLNPNLHREEPGYVIWRGTVPTSSISASTLGKIENKAINYPGKYNYCVIYTIPGKNGSLLPGETQINFAWYFWPPRSTSVSEIMTDIHGHTHRTTVPKGLLRPQIWSQQLAFAQKNLPAELVELVSKIQEPFVSVISSISAPRAAYFNNRLFLIGDALMQPQPNVGQGTSMAALGAMGLCEIVGKSYGKGEEWGDAVRKWERKLVQGSELQRVRSTAFGSWFLMSWWGIGRMYARFWWVYYWQRLGGW